MVIYLLNIILMFIWGIVLLRKNHTSKAKKVTYVFICSLQWILLSGLRHVSIGMDTERYLWYFEMSKGYTLEFLKEYIILSFSGVANGIEAGYVAFEMLVHSFTDEYQVYLVVVAVLFHSSLGYFVYKNSNNYFISFLIYSILFYSFFAVTGTRQTVATIFVLFAVECIKRKKLIWYMVLMLVSILIHKSAIFFILSYWLLRKKVTKNYMLLIATISVLIFIFKENFVSIAARLVGYENYGTYEGAGTPLFTMLMILIFFLSFIARKRVLSNHKDGTMLLNALNISIVLLPITWVNPSMMRGVQYFSIFIILLIPELFVVFSEGRNKFRAYILFIIVAIFLLIQSNPEYMFFWQ